MMQPQSSWKALKPQTLTVKQLDVRIGYSWVEAAGAISASMEWLGKASPEDCLERTFGFRAQDS